MAVYTFSTKTKKPQDDIPVQELKQYCDSHHLNFSGVIISLVKQYMEQLNDKA